MLCGLQPTSPFRPEFYIMGQSISFAETNLWFLLWGGVRGDGTSGMVLRSPRDRTLPQTPSVTCKLQAGRLSKVGRSPFSKWPFPQVVKPLSRL